MINKTIIKEMIIKMIITEETPISMIIKSPNMKEGKDINKSLID